MVRRLIGPRIVAGLLAVAAILSISLVTTASAQTPAPGQTPAPSAPAPTAVPFTATGNGTIKGSLANKTANGGSVANQDVTLGAYQGANEAGTKTTKTDQGGNFVFDGLATGAAYTYQLSVTYQGAPYYSDPVNFTGAVPTAPGAAQPTPQPTTQPTTEQTVQLPVYDATSDQSVLKTTAHHYLLEPDKTGVTVSEIVIVNNTSDKSYIGQASHAGTNSTLRFTLPDGAQNFEPVDGLFPSRVLQVTGGFVDTMPVYPGQSQRVWRYSFPANADSVAFTAKLDMAAGTLSVLVPDDGAKVSISNLTGPTNQDIQGEKYLVFSGQNVAAGTDLQFKVDGLSKVIPAAPPTQTASAGTTATTAGATSVVSPAVAAGIVALVIVLIAAVMMLSRRQSAQRKRVVEMLVADDMDETATGLDAAGDLEAERRQLVATIARLDDLFEQDKIGSEEYGKLRTEKKRRLIEVVKMQKAPVGAGEEQ